MFTIIIPFILYAYLSSAYNIHERPVMFRDSTPSYFGYSVLLYASKNPPRSWMIVGAPMSNLASVEEPGLVYRYDLDSQISKTVRPRELNDEIGHIWVVKKDHGWFGAAIALQPEDDFLTVCAPRTMIAPHASRRPIYSMHGVCYSGNITFDRLELDDKNLDSHDFASPFWYNPLHGFSVHYPSSRENRKMITGSPKEELVGSIRIKDQKSPVYFQKIDDLTMLGYAVTSGKFFNKNQLFYAGGAPGWNSIGRVGIIDPNTNPGTVIVYIDGTNVGEYFGASLTACDLNNDGLDEIIVGAPHSGEDHGKVYIYLGTLTGKIKNADVILSGRQEQSLFGYSLTCGDLDGDEFDDLIVGAPWEDNGAIYIFSGVASLSSRFQSTFQKISVTSPITTFGFSLAKPVDIDNNGFQDLAIGAYKSNYAIVLKSRPVIRSNFQAMTVPSDLNRNSTSFIIRICVNHTRKWSPSIESFILTINIDENLNRVQRSQVLLHHNASWNDEGESTICLNTTVRLMKTIRNYVDPITIMVIHKLGTTQISKKEGIVECDLCPVEYKLASRTQEILLPFDIDCGVDKICTASITLSGLFYQTRDWTLLPKGIWIIGSGDISLEISVSNHKEPAYLTILTLILPKNVFMRSILSSCTEKEEDGVSKVVCDVGNPLIIGPQKTFMFDLDMSNINNGSYDSSNLNFTAAVSTRSHQQSDSLMIFPLLLKTNASLKLVGRANERTYEIPSSNEATPNIFFEQKYQITKFGQTPMAAVRLVVEVPSKIEHTDVITLMNEPKITVSREVFQCSVINISILKPQNYTTLNAMDMDNTETFSLSSNNNHSRPQRDTDHWIVPLVTSNNENSTNNSGISLSSKLSWHNLNCSTPNVQCGRIICDIYALKVEQDSGRLELKFFINFSKLLGDELKSTEQITAFVTEAWIEVVRPTLNWTISGSKNITRVTTSFIKIKPTSRVSVWIVVGSILLGLLVLFLIAIGLRTMGFFERNKKGEIETMKNEDQSDMNHFSDVKL